MRVRKVSCSPDLPEVEDVGFRVDILQVLQVSENGLPHKAWRGMENVYSHAPA